jgi:hypothetical protein
MEAADNAENLLLQYVRDSSEPGVGGSDDEAVDRRAEDAADAVERLGGVSLIHLAVASDLSKLVPIDLLCDSDPVSAAESVSEPFPSSAIEAVAGDGSDRGRVLRAITDSAEQSDTDDGDEPDGPALDVVTELVDRAGECVWSVLVGVAPAAHVSFLTIKTQFDDALALAPADIQKVAKKVVGSIASLAKWVFSRAYALFGAVTENKLEIVASIFKKAKEQAVEFVFKKPVRRVVAAIFNEAGIRTTIKQNYLKRVKDGRPQPDNKRALNKILKHNKRWVARPVPILAHRLRPLWMVHIGVVPVAPIAACLLLAWTTLFTGDQLDAPGPFPNLLRQGVLGLT